MFLTIDELLEFKAKYEEELAEVQRKILVVDGFIDFVKAKAPVVEEETVEEMVETAETELPTNY